MGRDAKAEAQELGLLRHDGICGIDSTPITVTLIGPDFEHGVCEGGHQWIRFHSTAGWSCWFEGIG